MNRIVLIGNGFDLAHGLPTRYQDFIDWYWEQRIRGLCTEFSPMSKDILLSLHFVGDGQNTWHSFMFQHSFMQGHDWREFYEAFHKLDALCEVYYSPLFKAICRSIESKNWVDIENEYYDLLKQYIFNVQLTSEQKSALVRELDEQLAFLQQKLTEYLSSLSIDENTVNPAIHKNLFASINAEEISVEWVKGFKKDTQLSRDVDVNDLTQKALRYNYRKESLHNFVEGLTALKNGNDKEAKDRLGDFEKSLLTLPDQILFLSFNYTSTIDLYCPQYDNYFKVNHIHGTLDNPESVIFGYGDELDERYKEIKNQNNNVFLRNIKSIRYLESDNYRKMLQFIDAAPFQIYIMGDSCGNSDRTLLNTLFEHKNCISIKPFYYTWTEKDKDGNEQVKDNYLEIIQNISRNFTDMKKFRDRVVNKLYCKEITK